VRHELTISEPNQLGNNGHHNHQLKEYILSELGVRYTNQYEIAKSDIAGTPLSTEAVGNTQAAVNAQRQQSMHRPAHRPYQQGGSGRVAVVERQW